MKLKWLGHSCFLFTSDSGISVLADPFDPSIGYPAFSVHADIVTTSHDHGDHNYIKAVTGSFAHINKPGVYSQDGIEISSIATFHDEAKGSKRGKNIVNKYVIDGISLCHCGDLGHVLTPEQVQEIGHVDILMVPIGGYYTIDYKEAYEVVQQLKPVIVVPMHFKIGNVAYPIDTTDNFLNMVGGGTTLNKQEVELSKETLDQYAGTILLRVG